MKTSRLTTMVCAACVLLAAPPRLDAQDLLTRVEALYAAAAYEDALAVLPTDSADPDVEIYRISCLVALGRAGDAQRAIDAVVTAHPTFRPAEASPRIQELFRKSRYQLLPVVARRVYAEGKGALERKDRATAVSAFTEALHLLDDADVKGNELAGELRLLVSGFLDLAHALPVPEPVKPAPVEPPAPEAPPVTTPPIAIRETFPAWYPRDSGGRQFEFHGAIKVTIGADGTVQQAEMLESVEYWYDRLLLDAARSWTYKPATRAGVAIASEKIVNVNLKRR